MGRASLHGELLKLGVDVAQATVSKHVGRPRRPDCGISPADIDCSRDHKRGGFIAAFRPVLIAITVAAAYLATASLGGNFGKHAMVYFDHLANSFLHGRLDLVSPLALLDLTPHAGRWYVPFPPVPALLLLPLVAVLGPMAPLEVPVSVTLGGLNVALVYLLLGAMRRRGWIGLDDRSRLWLVGLFGFGTVHWYAACEGTVWYLSQMVTVTFLALAALAAVRRAHPAWTGVALALAVGTRPNVALALPFFLAELALRDREDGVTSRRWVRRGVMLVLPIGVAGLALFAYNAARFGDPLDFGYVTQNVDPRLKSDLRTYGQFNFHFLPRNAKLALASLPTFHTKFPFFTPRAEGMSLFLVTPAFLYLLRRLPRTLWGRGAWASLLLLNVPLLLYYNTGWDQLGYRFSLDYSIFALCLFGVNAGTGIPKMLKVLVLASIIINLRGVVWWFQG
jgi:hypothetical protein